MTNGVILCIIMVSLLSSPAPSVASNVAKSKDSKKNAPHTPNYKEYAIDTPGCKIKEGNINDPYVLNDFNAKIERCNEKGLKPFFIEARINRNLKQSTVYINEDILKIHYNMTPSDVMCTYQAPHRDESKPRKDAYFVFPTPRLLRIGSPMKEEYLWVKCFNLNDKNGNKIRLFHSQPLMLARAKEPSTKKIDKTVAHKTLHVLLLGIDAVSRMNFYRQFNQTLQYLRRKPTLVEFFGYHVVGLPSYPNQYSLITGKKELPGENYYDDVAEYIWKVYEKNGFDTLFFEEYMHWGLFTYKGRKGFNRTQTTYWPRPLMQVVDYLKKQSFCIGPELPGKIYLDYLYDLHVVLGQSARLYSYAWFCETTHDQINGGLQFDGPLRKFLERMDQSGILNRTALIMLADHGILGKYLKIGRGSEARLPFGFMLLPEWFYKVRPEALQNLKVNARRLVTPYDFHATLLELSDIWNAKRRTKTKHGMSLLSHIIPENRTCATADITKEHCKCQ